MGSFYLVIEGHPAKFGSEFSIEQVFRKLNERFEKREWFICYECNRLREGLPDISRPDHLCEDCIRHCPKCDEYYSKFTAWKHEDCWWERLGLKPLC